MSSLKHMLDDLDLRFKRAEERRALAEELTERERKKLQSPAIPGKIESSVAHKLFNEAESTTKLTPLESFIQTYSFYIKKLLWLNVDPFLTRKHNQYLI